MMQGKKLVWIVFFIFLGTVVLSSLAEARRRPVVSTDTNQEQATSTADQDTTATPAVELETTQSSGSSEIDQILQEQKNSKSMIEEDTPPAVAPAQEEQPEEEIAPPPPVKKQAVKKEPVKKPVEESTDEETGFNAWTPGNAMLRSLILPGWGQFFNEQNTKGYIFAGTEVVLLGTALMLYSQSNSTYDDYKNGQASYDDYTKKVDTTNMVVGVFAAVWIYNVIDAYIGAFEPTDQQSLLRKEGLTVAMNNDLGLSVIYTKKF
jgi:hypothetical protein